MYYMGESFIELFVMKSQSLADFFPAFGVELNRRAINPTPVVSGKSFIHSLGFMVWQTVGTEPDIDPVACVAVNRVSIYSDTVIDHSVDPDQPLSVPFNVISVDRINQTTDFGAQRLAQQPVEILAHVTSSSVKAG
jgi:hypothetical protein